MERSRYTKYERLMLVKECGEWCRIKGNSVASFAKMKHIKRTCLYNWKNLFSNIIDFNNFPTSENELDNILKNHSKKNQTRKLVKIEKINPLPSKVEANKEPERNITIKTQFCSIEIPDNCSKDSIINILTSIKEIQ
jgi:hypothetical protein